MTATRANPLGILDRLLTITSNLRLFGDLSRSRRDVLVIANLLAHMAQRYKLEMAPLPEADQKETIP
jgi:hypothetical protein